MSKKHEHEHCDCHEHVHEHAHSECGCGDCGHCHGEEGKASKALLAVSAILTAVSLIPMNSIASMVIAVTAVAIAAYPVLMSSAKNIASRGFGETELMSVAIIAASALGEFTEAAAVAILYRVGEILEDKAVEHSRKSISDIAAIQQDFANVLQPDGTTVKVDADEVEIGSEIMVMPYERFPIDGIVTSGASDADASAITGESLPVALSEGSEVKSGMINGSGAVNVRTVCEFRDSTASRIVQMVEEAAEKKGKTQKLISRIAKVYTPIVVGMAVLIAVIPSIITREPSTWIYRALTFLVASCPCALVISVPLGFYSGLGAAAKKGIIVKGTVFVEAIAKARAVAFDKTGTLTTGKFKIDKITPLGDFNEAQVLAIAAAAEHFSSHPIAKSITEAAPDIDESELSEFSEIAGGGTAVLFNGKRVICGKKDLLEKFKIDVSYLADDSVCVALDKTAIGSISLSSEVRSGTSEMIARLKALGIKKTFMLTGDNETAAKAVGAECGIDECLAGLLPEEKLEKLEEIKAEYGRVIYVGDGINDAPVLAAADAGVAMGLGTRAASEAADVILTNDSIERLAPTRALFRRTYFTVIFNIVFSIAVKAAVLVLGALGYAPIWLAVFADVGVCLICVLISSLIGFTRRSN